MVSTPGVQPQLSLGSGALPVNPIGATVAAATIPVAIAARHAMFREALHELLDGEEDIEVVAESGDGRDVVAAVQESRPAVVLLDFDLPGLSGLEVLREITRTQPGVRVLMLAPEGGDPDLVAALEHGAHGVIHRGSAATLLFKAIRAVRHGQYWVGRDSVAGLIQKVRERHAPPQAIAHANGSFVLTPREAELIAAVVAGGSNDDIASSLKISTKTVKHHLTKIFQKVGAGNRLELALFAIEHRLCPAPPR